MATEVVVHMHTGHDHYLPPTLDNSCREASTRDRRALELALSLKITCLLLGQLIVPGFCRCRQRNSFDHAGCKHARITALVCFRPNRHYVCCEHVKVLCKVMIVLSAAVRFTCFVFLTSCPASFIIRSVLCASLCLHRSAMIVRRHMAHLRVMKRRNGLHNKCL